MWVWRSIFISLTGRDAALRRPRTSQRDVPTSKRLHRLRLRDLVAALFAGSTGVVRPKILHRLAKVVDDIGAIKIDVFDDGPAIVAIEDDVLMFAWRAASFHHNADCVRRPHRRVRNIGRNEESFTFAHEMIDDFVVFADADFD